MSASEKFAIHEAARDGKRKLRPDIPRDQLTPHSAYSRVFAWCKMSMPGEYQVCFALVLTREKVNPKLANRRDDDERLPIHWAVSYNHIPVVQLLVQSRDFDPDAQVLDLHNLSAFA